MDRVDVRSFQIQLEQIKQKLTSDEEQKLRSDLIELIEYKLSSFDNFEKAMRSIGEKLLQIYEETIKERVSMTDEKNKIKEVLEEVRKQIEKKQINTFKDFCEEFWT